MPQPLYFNVFVGNKLVGKDIFGLDGIGAAKECLGHSNQYHKGDLVVTLVKGQKAYE